MHRTTDCAGLLKRAGLGGSARLEPSATFVELFAARRRERTARKARINDAVERYEYSQKAVADRLGLHDSKAGRLLRRPVTR